MTTTREAKTILEMIQEPAAFGGNPPFWAEAMAVMPSERAPFLDPNTIPARCAAVGVAADRQALLTSVAATIAADPALSTVAWYLHWRVFMAPEKGLLSAPPTLLNRLGEQAGAFYLLLSLDFAPYLTAWHQRLGYPKEVTQQTLQQIICFESNHLRSRGCPGIFESQFGWFATYLVDSYVRLGRFEFQLHAYAGGVSAWKRDSDGQVIALAEQGARVGDNGVLLNGNAPTSEGWVAQLTETPEAVTGFPVDPEGRIIHKQVRLERPTWKPCLRMKDTVLDMHIPAGGGMDWASITDSFRQAHDFFTHHHPDRPFASLVLYTWFMDPQLADLLPAEANPLRLQRSVYLYPGWPSGASALWFVFLRDLANVDYATLPRDTSLQRALAAFLEKGGKWNSGGMFVLPEDMPHLQEGLYRDRFRALRPELGL